MNIECQKKTLRKLIELRSKHGIYCFVHCFSFADVREKKNEIHKKKGIQSEQLTYIPYIDTRRISKDNSLKTMQRNVCRIAKLGRRRPRPGKLIHFG